MMKRFFKKALAGATATAIAATSLALTSFAADVTSSTDEDGNYTGSVTIEAGNWWDTAAISKDELLGDTENPLKILFTSDYSFCVGYNSVEVTGTNEDGSDSYWKEGKANTDDVELYVSDINLTGYYLQICVSTNQPEATVSWTVYSSESTIPDTPDTPAAPDGVIGFTNSADVTCTSDWSGVTISKEDLIGDITSSHIVAIVFESDENFAIGYNGTDGSWVQENSTSHYTAYDIKTDVDSQYFSLKLVYTGSSESITVSWTVYVTQQLVSNIAADESFVMGSDELYSLDLWSVGTNDPTDITKVIVSVTMTDSNWDWANATLYAYTDQTDGTSFTIGASEHYKNGYSSKLIESKDTAYEFELPLSTQYWYQIGFKSNSGMFDINSITFMAGDDVYYQMTTLPMGEKLNGTSVSIEDGIIGLNFFMEIDDALKNDQGTLFAIEHRNGSKEYLGVADNETTDNGDKFTVYVNAKEMADDVTVYIKNDESTGKKYTYSIKDYAKDLLTSSDYDNNIKGLVKTMLVYGGYAQLYFGYNTDNLASDIDGVEISTNVSDVVIPEKYKKQITGTLPTGVEYTGSTLVLEGLTRYRHYFKTDDPSVFGEKGDKYWYEQKGDEYYIEISGIYAGDLGSEYTVEIGDWVLKYSAMSYAYAITNNTDKYSTELVDLVKSMYNLYIASDEYCASHNTTSNDDEDSGGAPLLDFGGFSINDIY